MTTTDSLSNPGRLPPFEEDDADRLVVIVETPKGSRNKYDFDPEARLFELSKVLPAGMAFPYDFGFVPSTLADDGDPLDVLVLMDEPAFVGCRLSCRLVGIIEGEQEDKKKGKATRNDRLVCVESGNHSFNYVRRIDDLGSQFEEEIAQFFVNYHGLDGSKYRILGVKGPAQALRQVKICMKNHRKHNKR
ncbi:MAG: inorganic diphosphatase [Gammaproteobacteria bacterium]|nr:inorganic diphosphatase [Gammaproteobacteria bacterium]MBV9619553.1 inorganic diphosphatase [Gammaproteobacteria bacterium]